MAYFIPFLLAIGYTLNQPTIATCGSLPKKERQEINQMNESMNEGMTHSILGHFIPIAVVVPNAPSRGQEGSIGEEGRLDGFPSRALSNLVPIMGSIKRSPKK